MSPRGLALVLLMVMMPVLQVQAGDFDGENPSGELPRTTFATTTVDAGPNLLTSEGAAVPFNGVVTPGEVTQVIWNDSFDSYSVGPLVSPWIDRSTGPNSATITNALFHGSGGNSVWLDDSSALDGGNAARFLSGTTFIDMTYWFYAPATAGLATLLIQDSSSVVVRAG